MNRRDVVKGGLVAVAAVAAPTVISGANLARAQGSVRTAAIEFDRKTWEQAHGAGDTGQNVVTYENGAYTVQFAGDDVVYVEVGWEDRGGGAAADAAAAVAALIPSDAVVKETFYAPPTPAGPVGLRFERSQNPALTDLMKRLAEDRTGGILAVYQEQPSANSYEPNVFRVSIAVGAKGRSSPLDQPSGFRGGLA